MKLYPLIICIILLISVSFAYIYIYDSNDTSTFTACDAVTSDEPPPNNAVPPDDCTTFKASYYGDVSADDNDYKRTAVGDDVEKFDMYSVDLTNRTPDLFYWNYSMNWTINLYISDGDEYIELYVWNNSASEWYKWGDSINTTTEQQYNIFINESVSDYIDGSNEAHLLVFGSDDNDVDAFGFNIETDYVSLKVEYDALRINSPSDNFTNSTDLGVVLNTSQIYFNNTVLYTWSDGIVNNTLCTNAGECESLITAPRNNTYNLTIYALDASGNNVNATVNNLTFGTFNNLYPGINIEFSNNSNSSSTTMNLTYNISDDNEYVSSTSLYINGILNQSVTYPDLDTSINYTVDFAEGKYNFSIQVTDSDSATNMSENYTFTVDQTNPTVTILAPTEGQILSDNVSINLNYTVSDTLTVVNTCWFNVDNAANSTISNCANTTFNVSEGNHNVTVFANDTVNNVNSDTHIFYISLSAPTFSLHDPSNGTNYSSGTNIFFNYTPTDANGIGQCQLYHNASGNFISNLTNSSPIVSGSNANFTQNFTDNRILWGIWCNDTVGDNNYSQNYTFTVDETAPTVTILTPANNSELDSNVSINLNYTVFDAMIGIDDCWFNVDNVANTTIAGCTNTTFNTTDGSHNVTLYANDTLNNVNSYTSLFTISLSAPAITLHSPNGNYFNNGTDIFFNYTPTDSNGIGQCQLYHNASEDFIYNSTNSTPLVSEQNANFTLNLSDNLIKWSVWCNDSLGNGRFSGSNFTFTVDTIYPLINSINISTTTGSQTIAFNTSVTDVNIDSCKYSIYNSTGQIDGLNENVSIDCNALNEAATVSAYATYTLKIYAIDLAGNENSSNESFTVQEASGVAPGGGGGGGETITQVIQEAANFTIETITGSDLLDFILAKDSTKPRIKSVYLKNTGLEAVNVDLQCNATANLIINICDYVEFENTSLTIPPSELATVEVKVSINTPQNASFGDVYDFNIIASTQTQTEKLFSKLSVQARVPYWGLVYKWKPVPLTDGRFNYPVLFVAFLTGLVVLLGSTALAGKKFRFTGFFAGVLAFLIIFMSMLVLL